jgi:outer membrane lipoprotein-sorting protein
MKSLLSLPLVCAAAIICAAAALNAEPLDAILARMDASARQFHSFSASMKRTDVTTVIQESEVMNGTIRMKRNKNSVSGVMDFTDPNPHTIAITGRAAERYFPKANVVEIYDATKYASVMDGYLLLGFGTTAAELAKAYDVKAGGTETVGSANTTRIELTPKSPEVLKLIRKIELWIPEGQSNPVQEKITDASKNTILVLYSDVKVNPDLPDSAFELKLPAGVKKLTPNK